MKLLLPNLIAILTFSSFSTIDPAQTPQPPIDIRALKKETWLTTTSGVVTRSQWGEWEKPKGHQFFGCYYLIDRTDPDNERAGQLVVSVPVKAPDWKYDNTAEVFTEIKLTTDKVKLWNTLHVGSSSDELKAFMGSSFFYIKGTTFHGVYNDYILNGTLKDGAVKEIIVGIYRLE